MKIIVSQPLFFPWLGALEKIKLADYYVHYDDVQFSKGSFTNRVQIKTPNGSKWLTVPLRNLRLGQLIQDVKIDAAQEWRERHLRLLAQHYKGAPFKNDLLRLVEHVYREDWYSIGDLSIASMEALCNYFAIVPSCGFIRSSQLQLSGCKSERLLAIVKTLQGNVYICGPGKQSVRERYLDHEAFERNGIRVEYIKYEKRSYSQLHGSFTSSVSTLDLLANLGMSGRSLMISNSVYWRDFDKLNML